MVIEGSRAATLFQTVTVILSHYYLFSVKFINRRIIYQVCINIFNFAFLINLQCPICHLQLPLPPSPLLFLYTNAIL
jgi:hypothetical protein